MNQQPTLPGLCGRAAVVHTITYMFMGIIASAVLDYKTDFARPEMACWMRQFDDPILRAGVLFQPIRGALFGFAFYPLREFVFGKKNGWLTIWWLLVALAILGTFGPAPGSLERMIFTRVPGSISRIPRSCAAGLPVFRNRLLLGEQAGKEMAQLDLGNAFR